MFELEIWGIILCLLTRYFSYTCLMLNDTSFFYNWSKMFPSMIFSQFSSFSSLSSQHTCISRWSFRFGALCILLLLSFVIWNQFALVFLALFLLLCSFVWKMQEYKIHLSGPGLLDIAPCAQNGRRQHLWGPLIIIFAAILSRAWQSCCALDIKWSERLRIQKGWTGEELWWPEYRSVKWGVR
jgi:hypothetical protein